MGGEGTPRSDIGPMIFGAIIFMINCAGLIGIAIVVVAFVSQFHFIKTPTEDELYGCTIAQQALNGECR